MPDDKRGRVLALWAMTLSASAPIGHLLAGQAVTVNPEPGSMQDYSVQHTEERPLWHDMVFDKHGVLLRAWLSDQRSLADSEAP